MYRPANVARIANAIDPKIRDFLKIFFIFFDFELTNQLRKKYIIRKIIIVIKKIFIY